MFSTTPNTGTPTRSNISTPQEVAVGDSLRGAKMFERVGVPVIGVAENMSYFVCPHCGERTEVFRAGGGQRLAGGPGVPPVGRGPLQGGGVGPPGPWPAPPGSG